VVVALATLQRLAIVPGVAARAQAESGEARHHRAQRQASFDPSGILLYTPEYVEKLSKKSLRGVSSAKIAVISQRNEPSLLCFVGFYAFVLRLARLFRQFY
jgi:hypothetical protein